MILKLTHSPQVFFHYYSTRSGELVS